MHRKHCIAFFIYCPCVETYCSICLEFKLQKYSPPYCIVFSLSQAQSVVVLVVLTCLLVKNTSIFRTARMISAIGYLKIRQKVG